ncbi:hypothetical protein CGLO_17178 [Colletotrichum gloeosporioides Cg-14]|uniref:Uncharacterized protein n=1 Tax=Colletotrichum gloeosporioides (strain Cg-14) TaxID=1237896 RepID=T0L768_COLGC|nr:hypothetical protein CGLO_17178 [Colletotrichum gloeosporioides Cg-14]
MTWLMFEGVHEYHVLRDTFRIDASLKVTYDETNL